MGKKKKKVFSFSRVALRPSENYFASFSFNLCIRLSIEKKRRKKSNMSDYDYLVKVVLIGESGVGKSSIVVRFTDDEFDEEHPCTIGVDFKSKKMNVENKAISLNIWDTAGQEKFRSLTTTYYRGSQGIILVYDVTSQASFESVASWLSEAELYCSRDDVVKL